MEQQEIYSIAQRIRRYRLELPARLFLEMHKPLGSLFRESMVLGAPILSLLFGKDGLRSFQAVCADTQSMETLISYLEE